MLPSFSECNLGHTMRYTFVCALLLAGCAFDMAPSHRPQEPAQNYYREPPEGCIQTEYRRSSRAKSYHVRALYQHGMPVADGQRYQESLLELTREDAQAHGLAQDSLRYTRLETGLFSAGVITFLVGMLSIPLISLSTGRLSSNGVFDPVGEGIGVSLIGLGGMMIALGKVPVSRHAAVSFQRSVDTYNAHTAACADPASHLASTLRMREEAGQRASASPEPNRQVSREGTKHLLDVAKEVEDAENRKPQ